MTLHTTPSAGAMALLLLGVAAVSILSAVCGIALRRVAMNAFAKFGAGILFALGVVALGVFSFPLLYPHHHHDTVWIPGSWKWNYPIDAVWGIAYWLVIVVLQRRWKRAGANSRLAV